MSKRRQWYHARSIRREDYPLLVRCERSSTSFTREGERKITYRLDFNLHNLSGSSNQETAIGLLPVGYVNEMEKLRFALTGHAYHAFERLMQYCMMGKTDPIFIGFDTMIREQLPSFTNEAMFRAFWFLADYADSYLETKKEDLGENVANNMWYSVTRCHELPEERDRTELTYYINVNIFAALATYAALTNAGCGYGFSLESAKCDQYCKNIRFLEIKHLAEDLSTGVTEEIPIKENKENYQLY